jgi:hypothetical protein
VTLSYPLSLRILRHDRYSVSTPTIYTTYNLFDAHSAGTGFGRDGLVAAIGEQIERSYFRAMVPVSGKLPLSQMGFSLSDSYLRALFQISTRNISTIEAHDFETVSAVSLLSGIIGPVPRLLVSLDRSGDREFFPHVDTTGCAVHIESRACFVGALREFVERQAALASWIGPWPAREVEMNGRLSAPSTFFTDQGRLRVFDVGGPTQMPVILSVFQSNDSSKPVQFACGLGAHPVGAQAIEKSLMELFQIFELTRLVAIGEVEDERVLLRYNHPEMLFEWPFMAAENLPVIEFDDYKHLPAVGVSKVIEAFSEMGVELLYFSERRIIGGTSIFFGRVFSPDAFLCSMEHEEKNWRNTFSEFHRLDLDRALMFPCPLF